MSAKHGTGSKEYSTTYDFLSIGELVVDFISDEVAASLANAKKFSCFIGGQATNLAVNMARLGSASALAACVGYDGLGQFAKDEIERAGVHSVFMQTTREAPTTIAAITRQTRTPDFIIQRGADAYLRSTIELNEALKNTKIVHTSAFAISREPARTTILAALKAAKSAGAILCFDPNFAANIWPDRPDLIDVIKETFKLIDITKPSLEDCSRLFGPRNTPEEYASIFLEWGASLVLISMGEQGVHLACTDGNSYLISASNGIDVKDVTGAGDAYWAGFLTAVLHDCTPLEAARIGQSYAETKLLNVGMPSAAPSWEELLHSVEKIEYSPIKIIDEGKNRCKEVIRKRSKS